MSASAPFWAFLLLPLFSGMMISERKWLNAYAAFLGGAALLWLACCAFWMTSGATLSFETFITGAFAIIFILLGFIGILVKRWSLQVVGRGPSLLGVGAPVLIACNAVMIVSSAYMWQA